MDHPEYAALLRAICADPDDDTPRLVAADWVEEHGDPDRAAFIRIQVELARLEASGLGKSLEADALRKKERAYLGPLSMERLFWAADACPELVRMPLVARTRSPLEGVGVDGADRVTFRRGFVEAVRCPVVDWRHHGVAVRARQPVREVHLTGCDRVGRDVWYETLPALRGLRRVELDEADAGLVAWLQQWLTGTAVSALPPR